jgi:hypothetical protein
MFTSMGVEAETPYGNGSYCFQIHGQIYYFGSLLHPNEEIKPAILYFWLC